MARPINLSDESCDKCQWMGELLFKVAMAFDRLGSELKSAFEHVVSSKESGWGKSTVESVNKSLLLRNPRQGQQRNVSVSLASGCGANELSAHTPSTWIKSITKFNQGSSSHPSHLPRRSVEIFGGRIEGSTT